MTAQETEAILTLSLLAAFVDGDKHERERAEIKRIAEALAADARLNLPLLYQDVLMKRVSIATAAKGLQSLESKQLAYEMAVCVCDADGAQSQAEQRFLQELRAALALDAPTAAAFSRACRGAGRGAARHRPHPPPHRPPVRPPMPPSSTAPSSTLPS